ncbi:relaxase/mobilization nuclease domain-containing protein [uncultured Roseobacter sp.]|uniref:relaxase/mobilization nuclease domain-containing protein n=1 Tax=uncultured Roseobacter sp. TaxID=114847 RepID=UPI0026192CE2|nr:relaxase/mobilization nuclease domain-containing protein [uncultured Roseobacter sp.]
MILKGNIRANGQELARHLLNDHHEIDPDAHTQPPRGNERVEVAELRGFAASDLAGAFQEIEAVAAGTKSTKPIYSLSINPSEPMTREQYAAAIDKIEDKLGLQDQPRAVVFHVKDGREHCHVAWSRIDLEKMQARHMEFDRQKLREVARELVRDLGHEMPKHLGEDRGTDRFKDRFAEVSLAEKGQSERSGVTPSERRETITEAYHMADSATAFRSALQEQGYTLAEGDKRGFVVLDHVGEVHALNRQIEGVKAKDIRETLRLDDLDNLPTVQQAKEQIAELARQTATERPQEREDPTEALATVEDTLQALRDAQRAEMKALNGSYRETLAALRETETERIDDTKAAIKEVYREDWRDLFQRQEAERQAIEDMTATAGSRLKSLLSGRAGDAFDFENRGTLAGAFRFLARGEIDTAKLEKAQEAERKELGDLQRLAEREEIRAIRQEVKEQRAEAREQHDDVMTITRESYADQLDEALENVRRNQRIIEDQGRDLSKGDVAERENRYGFASSPYGLAKDGGYGLGRGREDDDDDERPFKPPTPGQSFTP